MNKLKIPYSINDDSKRRVEWLSKRIELSEIDKEYVQLQLKESATLALRQFGCHSCANNPNKPIVPEVCDSCKPETLSNWKQADNN